MSKTIKKSVAVAEQNLLDILGKIQHGICDAIFNSAGLAIGSSSKKKVKIANTVYGVYDGKPFSKTTAEVTLAGTVTNAKFNIFAITLKADGTAAARMGTEGATLAAVVFPTIPEDEILIGFAIVNPTGTGNFVGGTTDLDDATVVPNAAYVNNTGAININAFAL